MRRLLPVLALATLVAAGCASQRVTADQAAVVNGQAISLDELSELVQARKGTFGPGASPPDVQSLTRDALRLLIQSSAVLAGAQREGVTVSDADVNARIDQAKQQLASQGADFQAYLRQEGLTDSILRYQVRTQLAAERVAAKLVPPRSDAELRRDLDQRKEEFLQLRVRHVLVRDKALAERVRAQLVSTGDWSGLARRYSIDANTKDRGGDLGYYGKGQTVAPFDTAMFQLAGQGNCKGRSSGPCSSPLSAPVQTQYGFHLLQVTGVRVPELDDQLRGQLDQSLRDRRDQAFRTWFNNLMRSASITVNPRFGRWDAASGRIVDRPTAPQTVPPQPGQGGPATTQPGP